MGWNYVATLNPSSDWSIEHLPGAAVDGSGNLWVLWGNGSVLNYITVPIPQNGEVLSVSPTTVTNQQTSGPASLVPTGGQQMLAVWRGWTNQNIYYGLLSAGSTTMVDYFIPIDDTSEDGGPANGTGSADGPVASPGPSQGTVFVAWRGGSGNPNLYYSTISGVGTSTPSPTASSSQQISGFQSLQSSLSPAVATTLDGNTTLAWMGVKGDNTLYTANVPATGPTVGVQVTYTGSDGSTVTPTTLGRPTLALQGTGASASVAVVYPPSDAPGELHYLVGPLGGDTWPEVPGVVQDWAPPTPSSNTVPLADVLANAAVSVVDGVHGAVTFTNPMAVWATAPAASDNVYLVVGDQVGGVITGPLYVVRYSG